MKLSYILENAGWTHSRDLNHTASGGYRKASGLWAHTASLKNDELQLQKEQDFLRKVRVADKKGYEPEETFSYSMRNRIKNLEQAGFIVSFDGRFYITKKGKDWLESFDAAKQQNLVHTHIPAFAGGVTGIGK